MQGLVLMAGWENKAPSPSKINRQGRLLPPEQAPAAPAAAGAARGAAAAPAVATQQADEEFFDAEEELLGIQQQEGGAAGDGAAAEAPGGSGLPPGALHLRTQPDEVQWTNADEPVDSLPTTLASAAGADLSCVLCSGERGLGCCLVGMWQHATRTTTRA